MSRARENADGARLDAPLASPAFTGTPTGITAAHLEAGVLPSDVTGGSGLTALGTVASGNLSNTAIVYPTGHVLQTVGDTDDTQRTIASPGGTALEGVRKAITSTVANSNFYITGNIQIRCDGGHWGYGIFLDGLTTASNLLYTPSQADNSGSASGWHGERYTYESSTQAHAAGALSYFYDAGSNAAGTSFTFYIGAMGYAAIGAVYTNFNSTINGRSTITIQEISP